MATPGFDSDNRDQVRVDVCCPVTGAHITSIITMFDLAAVVPDDIQDRMEGHVELVREILAGQPIFLEDFEILRDDVNELGHYNMGMNPMVLAAEDIIRFKRAHFEAAHLINHHGPRPVQNFTILDLILNSLFGDDEQEDDEQDDDDDLEDLLDAFDPRASTAPGSLKHLLAELGDLLNDTEKRPARPLPILIVLSARPGGSPLADGELADEESPAQSPDGGDDDLPELDLNQAVIGTPRDDGNLELMQRGRVVKPNDGLGGNHFDRPANVADPNS